MEHVAKFAVFDSPRLVQALQSVRTIAVPMRYGSIHRKATQRGMRGSDTMNSGAGVMIDSAPKCGEIIKHLEDALALADELEDGATGSLIERALDEARSRQFRLSAD